MRTPVLPGSGTTFTAMRNTPYAGFSFLTAATTERHMRWSAAGFDTTLARSPPACAEDAAAGTAGVGCAYGRLGAGLGAVRAGAGAGAAATFAWLRAC